MNEDRLLTIKEAAYLLSVTTGTLRKWDKVGYLKAVIINKRGDRRYKREDIEKIVDGK